MGDVVIKYLLLDYSDIILIPSILDKIAVSRTLAQIARLDVLPVSRLFISIIILVKLL